MNYHSASDIARARSRQLLADAAEHRRLVAPLRVRRTLRRRLGAALASFGYAFVALGKALSGGGPSTSAEGPPQTPVVY